MKKLLFCAAIICATFTIYSCKPTPDPDPNPVSPVTQGVCVPLRTYAGNVTGERYEYDAQHRITKWTGYNSNNTPFGIYDIAYNTLGKINKVSVTYTGNPTSSSSIIYDGNGDPSTMETLGNNNVVVQRSLSFFDTSHRITRKEFYQRDTSGNMVQTNFFTLTYTGNSRRPSRIDRTYGSDINTILYEYDTRNNMTKVSQFPNGATQANQVDTYTYDTSKNYRSVFSTFASFIGRPPENYYNGESNTNNFSSHKIEVRNTAGMLATNYNDTYTYPMQNANNYALTIGTRFQHDTIVQTGSFNIEYDCY
jgi:hypothetical protein